MLQNVIHIVDNLLDRRSNPSLNSTEARATLAKINYATMLQLPARAPGQAAHNDVMHAPAPQATMAMPMNATAVTAAG